MRSIFEKIIDIYIADILVIELKVRDGDLSINLLSEGIITNFVEVNHSH